MKTLQQKTEQAYKEYETKRNQLEQQARTENRVKKEYDPFSGQFYLKPMLTETEKQELNKLQTVWQELNNKFCQQEKAEKQQKKEEAKQRKIAKDLKQGITPEQRKAMTYAKRYAKQIEKMEKELAELKAKKTYWENKAQQ